MLLYFFHVDMYALLLKEMCNRLAGVESKLSKLDSIEERINSKFKHFDSELVCAKIELVCLNIVLNFYQTSTMNTNP